MQAFDDYGPGIVASGFALKPSSVSEDLLCARWCCNSLAMRCQMLVPCAFFAQKHRPLPLLISDIPKLTSIWLTRFAVHFPQVPKAPSICSQISATVGSEVSNCFGATWSLGDFPDRLFLRLSGSVLALAPDHPGPRRLRGSARRPSYAVCILLVLNTVGPC